MSTYIFLILCGIVFSADGRYYAPKGFYFIDENGHASPLHSIDSEVLNRVRRQSNPFNFQFPQINIPQGQGQSSFVSSSQTLNSRFGEEPTVAGQSVVYQSSGNKYQQTTTVLKPDGSVTTNKQSGRVRRQANQVQSQGNGDGMTQFQSQTGDSGNQFQSQSQPGMQQTQSQGTGPVDGQSFDRNSDFAATDRAQNLPPTQQPNYNAQEPTYNAQQPPHNPQQQNNYQQQPYVPQQGGFYQPGFTMPFGFGQFGSVGFPFQQPAFGFAPFPQAPFGGFQPQPPTTGLGGGNLDNRFSEDEHPSVVTGGTHTSVTNQNGVIHSSTSILKPDGQVITTQHKFPKKM